MECDVVLALPRATVDGQTLFGQRSSRLAGPGSGLCRVSGRTFVPGEKLSMQFVELPQARQTFAVLGYQADGCQGYEYGVNEHQVAVGCLALPPTLPGHRPGLLGPELTRLVLERSQTARHAVDLLGGLVERYGQGAFPGCPALGERDNAFLVVDPAEAYAVETAGRYWVYQEIQEVRAATNVRVIRQDWDRIAPGLASYAISHGSWPDDGSKLDFAGALGEEPRRQGAALRRWGRTTLLLMEQSGHIDVPFMRHLLDEPIADSARGSGPTAVPEHGQDWYKQLPANEDVGGTARFIVSLTRNPARLPMTWCTLGTTHAGLYFPIFLDGEPPAAFTNTAQPPSTETLWPRLSRLSEQLEHEPERRPLVRDSFARLQARLDQETEEFNAEGASLKQRGAWSDLHRQATLFMQYNLERFEEVVADALRVRTLLAAKS